MSPVQFITDPFGSQAFSILEFPQNYPHQINLPHSVIHNFQKMPKI